jgi:hypothetical protein
MTRHVGDPKDIQVKHFNGPYKIYCFGNNITISDQVLKCPDHVFELPISEKFELNGEIHDLGETSIITVNAIELYVSNQIAEQQKTDKVKIYGANTTALDNAFAGLTRLSGAIKDNIEQIQTPITNWFLEAIKTPIEWVRYVLRNVTKVDYLNSALNDVVLYCYRITI